MAQICSKCKEEKPINEFNKHYTRKDGVIVYQKTCRECKNIYLREYHKIHGTPEYLESRKEYSAKYRKDNSEKLKEKDRKRYRKDPKKKIAMTSRYHKDSEKYKKWRRKYENNKRATDLKWKLNANMGSAIYRSVNGNKGGIHWESIVDYNLKDLKEHLENKFQEGMNWDNYGEWHIDHVKPKSWFNFNSPKDKEFKECWALENLQPLWAEDNLKKSNLYEG